MWVSIKLPPLSKPRVELQPSSSGSNVELQETSSQRENISPVERLGAGNGKEIAVSEGPVEVDLEAGVQELKGSSSKREGVCRICQLGSDATVQDLGLPMELGCSCKGDLAAAHKQCAESWFKIRGNNIRLPPLNQSRVDSQASASGSNVELEDSSHDAGGNSSQRENISPDERSAAAKGKAISVSECPVEVDVEAGVQEIKGCSSKREGVCRICQLSSDATVQELGLPMELGCSCKGDLSAAHRQCAESWFKIKRNTTCEVCGAIASNVSVEPDANLEQQQPQQHRRANHQVSHPATALTPQAMSQNFWQDHRLLNILLAVMVFAFILSWLFHFKAPQL